MITLDSCQPTRHVTFQGRVPSGGFRLLMGHTDTAYGTKSELVLVAKPSGKTHEVESRYDLACQKVILPRLFADTALTPEVIVAFASAYGLLGTPVPFQPDPQDGDSLDATPPVCGEPLSEWRRQ